MFPEALLAASVVVCEGASEVGLARGLDQFRVSNGERSITACGVALVDGGGTNTFTRAVAFQKLGYRTAVLRDSDIHHDKEAEFVATGSKVFGWREGLALEDEMFASLSDAGVEKLVEMAVELKEESLINDHIKSASNNACDLTQVRAEFRDTLSEETCTLLGKAAKSGKGWFKNVTAMETVAREVIGPDPADTAPTFKEVIDQLFDWASDDQL